jgi:hypothetical protein
MPAMSDDGFRVALEGIEARLAAGERTEGAVALAYVAAQLLALDKTELAAARRRALFVLAAGGDPHRALELDSPAVESLRRDLDAPGLRGDLTRTLRALGGGDRLPHVSSAAAEMLEDEDLALRLLAVALLAEELGDEG